MTSLYIGFKEGPEKSIPVILSTGILKRGAPSPAALLILAQLDPCVQLFSTMPFSGLTLTRPPPPPSRVFGPAMTAFGVASPLAVRSKINRAPRLLTISRSRTGSTAMCGKPCPLGVGNENFVLGPPRIRLGATSPFAVLSNTRTTPLPGPPLECEDRLRQGTVHDEFVVDRIVFHRVHRPADLSFLTFQNSYGNHIFFRQPGVSHNYWRVHSVGYQILFPLAVIRHHLRLAEFQGFPAERRTADFAGGRCVSIRGERVTRRRRVTHVGYPHLFIFGIDRDACGMVQTGLVSFEDFHRRHVAIIGTTEDEDRIADVVGHPQIAGFRIQREGSHPVQRGLWALNRAQRRSVTVGIEWVDRNGRRKELT